MEILEGKRQFKRNNYNEMIGKKFGCLIVTKVFKKTNKIYILCECECGKIKEYKPYEVFKGAVVSCGCYKEKNLEKSRIRVKDFISYEQMEKEIKKGKTDIQIGEEFGFGRLTIGILRRKYGFKTKFSDKKSYLNEKLLRDEQKEIILGTSMGDGYLDKKGNLKITHCSKQYPYLYWLHHKLKPLSGNMYYDETTEAYNFKVKSLDFTKDLRTQIYSKNRKKIVVWDVLKKLTPLSLAIWFMDDGSISGSNNSLHTEGYSHKDRKLICKYFKETWEINTSVKRAFNKKQNKYYYYNYFDAENSYKFSQIIKYHLLPSMLYKLRKDVRKHVIYLAGGMQYSPDKGVKWRRNLRALLNQKGYYCIDPTKEEDFLFLDEGWGDADCNLVLYQKNMRKIIEHDLHFVNMSEIIVCLYDDFVGGGTYHEIGESYLKNKKLYIININKKPMSKLSGWVLGCATKVVNTYEELMKCLPEIPKAEYKRSNGREGKNS